MEQLTFDDINLLDVGSQITLCGAIYEDMEGRLLLVPFPGHEGFAPLAVLRMNDAQWERFLYQSDVLDVQGPGKAILRKSQRHIDKVVQWKVWRRDGFVCRYCGKPDPLTIDHVICWEEGGATVLENLLSACGPCNKARRNTPFDQWIDSPRYRTISRNLEPLVARRNTDLAARLEALRAIQTKPRSR